MYTILYVHVNIVFQNGKTADLKENSNETYLCEKNKIDLKSLGYRMHLHIV